VGRPDRRRVHRTWRPCSGVIQWCAAVLGASPPTDQYILKHWQNEPTVGVRDGDVFMHNDARFGSVP